MQITSSNSRFNCENFDISFAFIRIFLRGFVVPKQSEFFLDHPHECLGQSGAAAADVVLMSADWETLAGELTLATWSGGRWLIGFWTRVVTRPVLMDGAITEWIWRVARQILHVPLDLFGDWESDHFWDIEWNTQHETCCQCSAPANAGRWLRRSKGKTPTYTKTDTNRGSSNTAFTITQNQQSDGIFESLRYNMTTRKTTKHDKTKAKSGTWTPKERDSTARTRSYPYYYYYYYYYMYYY